MRIFLSYGHDANEVLVRRIKADLELRGHDVWFDHSEIDRDITRILSGCSCVCCTIPVVSLSLNHRLKAFILVRMQIFRGVPQQLAFVDWQ